MSVRRLRPVLLALALGAACAGGVRAGTSAPAAAPGAAQSQPQPQPQTAQVTDDFGGGPRAAPGTPDAARINCMDRIHWRSGGSARLVQVIEMENGMTIVKAAGLFGLRYVCFADPDGEVVRVRRDQGFGMF